MRAELRRLHGQFRTTTVYVTHDQVEAMTLGDRIAVLHEGRIQQVGTRHELYHQPVNMFVARFIGSPAMNVAPARLTSGEHSAVILADGTRWPVPGSWTTDRDVIVGIRPHALVWPAPAGAPRLTATITASEFLGNAEHLLFAAPGVPPSEDPAAVWTAKAEAGSGITAGTEVTFGVDTSEIQFFDPSSGKTLVPDRRSEPAPLALAV